MDLDEFTHITLAVLEDHGAALAQGVQTVMASFNSWVDTDPATQGVHGVKSGPGEVTTGFHTAVRTQVQRISEMQQGFVVSGLEDCAWWTLGQGRDQ